VTWRRKEAGGTLRSWRHKETGGAQRKAGKNQGADFAAPLFDSDGISGFAAPHSKMPMPSRFDASPAFVPPLPKVIGHRIQRLQGPRNATNNR
jgi:hypothetical protein